MEHILLVDDEKEITLIVEEILRDEGYKVDSVNDGFSAVSQVKKQYYDLIILDIMMPGMSGLEVCQNIRNETKSPILFVTAKTSVEDQIKGLNKGGDDYINKPFSHEQLIARVHTHLRREKRYQEPVTQKKYGQLILNRETNKLFFKQEKILLTKREFKIIDTLMERPGQIFSKDHLYEAAWGIEAEGYSHTVTEHIRNIRARLQAIDPNAKVIHTVWGVGYKIE